MTRPTAGLTSGDEEASCLVVGVFVGRVSVGPMMMAAMSTTGVQRSTERQMPSFSCKADPVCADNFIVGQLAGAFRVPSDAEPNPMRLHSWSDTAWRGDCGRCTVSSLPMSRRAGASGADRDAGAAQEQQQPGCGQGGGWGAGVGQRFER